MQPAGSFKIRGIGNRARKDTRNIVSSSGGNAGLAAAYAGKQLGRQVTVFVPETTPASIRAKIQMYGATVVVKGKVYDEAHSAACQFAQQEDALLIHAFDHPHIWEGHATLVHELKTQLPGGAAPGAIILSVGGGGLYAGVCQGLKEAGWEKTSVVAVETVGADCFARAVEQGRVVTLASIDSIAKSLGSLTVAPQALKYTQDINTINMVVTDEQAMRACVKFADEKHTLVEPSCGASLAVLEEPVWSQLRSRLPDDMQTVVVVICGGTNISTEMIESYRHTLKGRDKMD